MIRSTVILSALALAGASSALAQQGGQQAPARGPAMAVALEAVEAAVASCAGNGIHAAAAVVDSTGAMRVLLTADGTTNDQIDIARRKAATAVTLKALTSEIADRMEKDQAFKAKIEADKSLFPRPGAVPFVVENEVIGAIGVSGGSRLNGVPGGMRDEACAKAGFDKVKASLK